MTRLSPVLRSAQDNHLLFFCPGCNEAHQIAFGDGAGPRWTYNGNPNAPTFGPSVLVRSGHYVPGHEGEQCWCNWPDKEEFPEMKCTICHSFVVDGRIQFLGDCTHALANQTVPIPPWPDNYGGGE